MFVSLAHRIGLFECASTNMNRTVSATIHKIPEKNTTFSDYLKKRASNKI